MNHTFFPTKSSLHYCNFSVITMVTLNALCLVSNNYVRCNFPTTAAHIIGRATRVTRKPMRRAEARIQACRFRSNIQCTSAVLRLECSIDCISGSVGHQQNIFRLCYHCQRFL